MSEITMKCGCKVNEQGQFTLGDTCKERNCGECRLMSKGMHPFGGKRVLDFMMKLE